MNNIFSLQQLEDEIKKIVNQSSPAHNTYIIIGYGPTHDSYTVDINVWFSKICLFTLGLSGLFPRISVFLQEAPSATENISDFIDKLCTKLQEQNIPVERYYHI